MQSKISILSLSCKKYTPRVITIKYLSGPKPPPPRSRRSSTMFQSHTIFSGKWLFSTRKALANEHEVGGSCSMVMHLRTAFKNRLSRNDASVNFFTKVCLEQKYSLFDIKFFLITYFPCGHLVELEQKFITKHAMSSGDV